MINNNLFSSARFADNPFLKDVAGKQFAQFGDFSIWPSYYPKRDPASLLQAHDAIQADAFSKDLDFIIIGPKRQKGKADALRRAQKFGVKVLDQVDLLYLTRPRLERARFAFAGGFDFLPPSLTARQGYSVLADIGCEHDLKVTEATDYLVLGEKRAKGKADAQKLAEKHKVSILTEDAFLDLIGNQVAPDKLNFQSLVIKLQRTIDPNRLRKALQMLQDDSFSLYSDHDHLQITGIISSQSGYSTAYSCLLDHEGSYSCCDDGLNKCMGMDNMYGRGICKHTLVLLLGLVNSGGLDANRVFRWVVASTQHRAGKDDTTKDRLAKTWLRYKGMKAGEIDWRPMETIPEDYYAF